MANKWDQAFEAAQNYARNEMGWEKAEVIDYIDNGVEMLCRLSINHYEDEDIVLHVCECSCTGVWDVHSECDIEDFHANK